MVGSYSVDATTWLEIHYNSLMAWDTQETQRRLLLAARAEFARSGYDGATMAQIANRAGLNKERLYNYFGDKRLLFKTVLTKELEQLAEWMAAQAPEFDRIGEFTSCIFDYHADHPELARLLLWEGLAEAPAVHEHQRTTHYKEVVARLAAAQRDGIVSVEMDAAKLLFLLIALAAWWFSVPQLARMITGADRVDPAERAARRACVVVAARRLALVSHR